ncbi:SecY-interacting protein [Alkalimarinus alittae]|uniref:SecY-interacting protein n=1 Tax=Alkalimarinus alittae TaxID=2961619 RepID=A0ABY6MYR6_9ALTE|nr:SecY-interacting protein [Alkalimarinus alittae]UZE94991.1 SecY-interacting protein [Alkalimarinus alittae]
MTKIDPSSCSHSTSSHGETPSNEPTLTIEALERLLTRFVDLSHKLDLSLPKIEYDKDWTSKCIVDASPNENGLIEWKPTIRQADNIFSHLESALDVKFHPDVLNFYGYYWSDGIVVSHDLGEMSLIQIWNTEDEEMLKQNLLGHAFAKKKNKLPLTLFIGCTLDDEVIAIDNSTGQIVLEKAGFSAHKVIANSMSEFLNHLTPTLKPYNG